MRVAAIDVGTNSVHLLVADVGPDGDITRVARDRHQVELGAGGLGVLTEDAMARGLTALTEFAETIRSLQVDAVVAAATSAVREASNGREFVHRVEDATGIRIRTIAGPTEARLIYLGVRPEIDFSRGYAVLVDIGGGSVEFSLCAQSDLLAAHSLPIGHIRMTEAFVPDDPPGEGLAAVRAHTRDQLRPVLNDIPPGVAASLLGTGGSVRTLARIATLQRGEALPQHDHGLVLPRKELSQLVDQLEKLTRQELLELDGMDPRRVRTLPSAAAVLLEAMITLDLPQLVTSDRSLRDGLLAEWVLDNEPELELSKTVPWPRMRTVLRMMERYDVEPSHSRHVADLALALWDGLGGLGLDSGARRTLEYAALLHDIGHHIDARDHHKHGQYLILNSRMPGFTAPEVAIVANVVRYHRGRPKRSHPHFRSLSPAGQRTVETLSAVLRMADALDHSHGQVVVSVEVEDGPLGVTIRANTTSDAHIERWAAERRQQRLSNVLNRPVTVVLERSPEGEFDRSGPLKVE